MKDSEFIELLNLYLDHEISAANAARLEAEVLGNPARRRVYQDYCRMQKACKVLAHEFGTEAATIGGEGKVVPFETAAPRRTGFYVAGAFAAAAACAALVFVVQSHHQPAPATPALAQVTNPASVDAKALVAAAPAAGDRAIGPTVMVRETSTPQPANTLLLSGVAKSADQSPLFVGVDQTAPQFAWLNNTQLSPVQRVSIDEFRSSARRPAATPVRASANSQPPTEWVVIRWQK
ncbi:MAG TPA: hypothetical protein VHD62_08360 [Opitutaceae bacterium]|nr:hypothetical protein [Opitutaceae bacterium]